MDCKIYGKIKGQKSFEFKYGIEHAFLWRAYVKRLGLKCKIWFEPFEPFEPFEELKG